MYSLIQFLPLAGTEEWGGATYENKYCDAVNITLVSVLKFHFFLFYFLVFVIFGAGVAYGAATWLNFLRSCASIMIYR